MSKEKDYILAIDLGTTTCKVVVFTTQGEVVGESSHEITLVFPHSTWVEVDPANWEKVVNGCIKVVLESFHISPKKILVVGICGLMHAPVLVNEDGNCLDNSPLWMDQRCRNQSRWLVSSHAEKIKEITGVLPTTTYSAPKLRWIVENKQEVFRKTYKILFPKDYIRLKLTGGFATDVSETQGTLLFDLREGTWSEELLDLIGIPKEKMPHVYEPIEIAGKVTPEAARKTGLVRGTPVVVGSTDVYSTLVGANIFSNKVCLYLGTSAWIAKFLPHSSMPLETKLLRIEDGAIVWIGSTATSGAALRWYREMFEQKGGITLESNTASYELFSKKATRIKSGANGIIFIPHLMGERGPEYNANARGAFFGLTIAHQKEHVCRAILEGTAFSIKHIIDAYNPKEFDEIVVVGGGVKNRIWTQIIADVTDKSLIIPQIVEAGSLGAAIIAGRGIGIFDNIQETSEKFVKIIDKYEARKELAKEYKPIYNLYLKLDATFKKFYEDEFFSR